MTDEEPVTFTPEQWVAYRQAFEARMAAVAVEVDRQRAKKLGRFQIWVSDRMKKNPPK